jgi:DNA-binding transcriptional LysR family regulator
LVTLNTYRLRVLREVAARGSIAASTEALHLTAPAISHHIASLERELGIALFERTPRSLKLTEAGRCLIGHSAKVLSACEEAIAAVSSFSSEISGTVRMSILETAANPGYMLLKERENHPSLQIMLISMNPLDALSALRVGEIDIALSNDWDCQPAPATIGTTRIELMTEAYHVVLPPSHPLANERMLHLRDLAREAWCLTQEQGFREALLMKMKLAGFDPNVVLSSFNSRALVLASEAGIGVSVVPASADTRGARVVLVPLAETALTRHVFALVRAGSEESPTISAVLDGMKEAVAEAKTWWYETCEVCGLLHLRSPEIRDEKTQTLPHVNIEQ